MIRSMTGFGEATRETPAGRLRLEIKTVNHRFFNPSIKTPSGFDRYEKEIADVLKTRLARGHVSVYLAFERAASAESPARIDIVRAQEIRAALEHLRAELTLSGEVDLEMMARFGEIFRTPEADRSEPIVDAEVLRALTEEAADAVVALREAEGLRLADDLRGRLHAMASELDTIERRAPDRLTAERDRLREAVRELTEQAEVDEDRLAREVAYLADKWDINEELVRFRSHIELFREALDGDSSEPVGKRLGFLVQEMHREANTIGSKANDAEISRGSVALKEEVERLREQVENVE